MTCPGRFRMESLGDDAKEELRAAFNVYDRDGNGSIDISEMRHMMKQMGVDVATADAAFKQADLMHNDVITFEEFCMAVGPIYSNSEVALRNAFNIFDGDGNGSIDRTELGAMLAKLGLLKGSSDTSTVERMFAAADANNDGKIDFQEFIALFAAAPPKREATAAAA